MYVYAKYYGKQKTFWEFRVFSTFAETFYLFTSCFYAFSLILDYLQKTETEKKNPLFAAFCRNTSLFVANKTLIFSVLWIYRANYTPPPRFWTRRVGQLSSEIFYFLFFIFFVKYSAFLNSAFLPNFEHFSEYHIYF